MPGTPHFESESDPGSEYIAQASSTLLSRRFSLACLQTCKCQVRGSLDPGSARLCLVGPCVSDSVAPSWPVTQCSLLRTPFHLRSRPGVGLAHGGAPLRLGPSHQGSQQHRGVGPGVGGGGPAYEAADEAGGANLMDDGSGKGQVVGIQSK